MSLESFRRNGEPLRTPLWFAWDSGKIYIRTRVDSGKAKRMRNNPRVRVAPCDYSGKPTGAWVEAEARPATGDESRSATALLNRKYNLQKWVLDIISKIAGGRYTVFVLRAI